METVSILIGTASILVFVIGVMGAYGLILVSILLSLLGLPLSIITAKRQKKRLGLILCLIPVVVLILLLLFIFILAKIKGVPLRW